MKTEFGRLQRRPILAAVSSLAAAILLVSSPDAPGRDGAGSTLPAAPPVTDPPVATPSVAPAPVPARTPRAPKRAAPKFGAPHRSWIQLGVVAYQDAGSEMPAQVAWNAANVDWFDSPDRSYLPTYKAAGNTSIVYDNYYCLYVGQAKYNAMLAWCSANNVPPESMFLHFSKITVVRLGGVTRTRAAGSRVPTYDWDAGGTLLAPGARVVMNVSSVNYQKFNAAYEAQTVGQYNGVFVDNSDTHVLTDNGGVVSGGTFREYPAATTFADAASAFNADIVKCFAAVKAAGIQQVANISEYPTPTTLLPYIVGVFRESELQPQNMNVVGFKSYLGDMAVTQAAGVYSVVATSGTKTAVSQMAALADYYIGANPTDYFCKGDSYERDIQQNAFFGALNVDIGAPQGPAYIHTTGKDSLGFTYTIWARQYTAGLVLSKPFPAWNDMTTGPATATPVKLANEYRQLNPDGSPSAASSKVMIENGTGAVLIR